MKSTSLTFSVFLVLTVPPSPQGVYTRIRWPPLPETAGRRKQPSFLQCNCQKRETLQLWGLSLIMFWSLLSFLRIFIWLNHLSDSCESETLKSWELSESVCYIRLWDILSLHSVVLKTIWICYCSLGCWFGPLISTVNSWSNSSIYDTQLIVAIKLLYYH